MRNVIEQVKPEVGMGATLTIWTDREAYTIIAVSASGKQITMQKDRTTLLNPVGSDQEDALRFSPGGFVGHTSGVQRHSYEHDATGKIVKASLRKNGRWKVAGHPANSPGMSVQIGKRSEHYDFNF